MPETAGLPPEMLAAAEAAHAWNVRAEQQEITNRARMIRFAGIMCSCPVYFSWSDGDSPYQGCPVHGQVLITHDGRIMI
jgi:hypothetical protein